MAGTQLDNDCATLAHVYHDLVGDLNCLDLGVEGDKLELMHLWRNRSPWHPDKQPGPDLVIRDEGRVVRLQAKSNMRCLGLFLDCELCECPPHARELIP